MAKSTHPNKNAKSGKSPTPASSQGDSPVDIIPKDVSPDNASWKDRTVRQIHSENKDEKVDALLDEASDLSFPASDPIAVSAITRIEKKTGSGDAGSKRKS